MGRSVPENEVGINSTAKTATSIYRLPLPTNTWETRDIMAGNVSWSLRPHFRYLLLLSIVAPFMLFGWVDMCFIILAFYVFLGRIESLEGIFITWLVVAFNYEGFSSPDLSLNGKFLVIGAATAATSWRWIASRKFTLSAKNIATSVFIVFLVGHALGISQQPAISLMKSLLWGMSFLTVYSNWLQLGEKPREQVFLRIIVSLMGTVAVSNTFSLVCSSIRRQWRRASGHSKSPPSAWLNCGNNWLSAARHLAAPAGVATVGLFGSDALYFDCFSITIKDRWVIDGSFCIDSFFLLSVGENQSGFVFAPDTMHSHFSL